MRSKLSNKDYKAIERKNNRHNTSKRNCPRCSGNIAFRMPIKSSTIAFCIAKCEQCGRSWGICHADAKNYVVINEEKALDYAIRKWNRGEIVV